MVNTSELRGVIAKNGKTQSDVARMLNITPKTFYTRMQRGVFGSDEIQTMIEELHIDNPMDIFFYESDNLKSYYREQTVTGSVGR